MSRKEWRFQIHFSANTGKSKSGEKTQRGTFFAKTFQRGTFLLFLPLSISTSLRKLLLLHNLSRTNTHDKFTLEDVVITEMIRIKAHIRKIRQKDGHHHWIIEFYCAPRPRTSHCRTPFTSLPELEFVSSSETALYLFFHIFLHILFLRISSVWLSMM